jgi:hypothetical protein
MPAAGKRRGIDKRETVNLGAFSPFFLLVHDDSRGRAG